MDAFTRLEERRKPLAVVGLGYVGLPLAVAFAERFEVIGFDINAKRVEELKSGHDRSREVDDARLTQAVIEYTTDPAAINRAEIIIVAVPTPIDGYRRPDLTPVRGSSITVGQNMAKGAIVVYESTVYPGLTEEFCVPLLEEHSGLKYGRDFTVGYSPERINPGDKVHTLQSIVKIVSGSDAATTDVLARLYSTVVTAGVHRASSIKVAEAAKVIENTQRDLNIALMNELSLIFDLMDIDTLEVLEAAGTKWNFLPFRPGMVGGHCIGVDPYYLTFKAEALGYHPEVILAGRRTNDFMGRHVAQTCVKLLIKAGARVNGARVGVLGLTFKENVPDLRNTRVVDVLAELADYEVATLVHDPLALPDEAREEYGLELTPLEALRDLDALILAVPHAAYAGLDFAELRSWFRHPERAIILDVKGGLDPALAKASGVTLWRL